jgi:hypothetical protein
MEVLTETGFVKSFSISACLNLRPGFDAVSSDSSELDLSFQIDLSSCLSSRVARSFDAEMSALTIFVQICRSEIPVDLVLFVLGCDLNCVLPVELLLELGLCLLLPIGSLPDHIDSLGQT